MITTVLLDLDDTILSDDIATEAAFMATALKAQEVAGVDPHELIAQVRITAAREWREGPFPDWLDGIGTSGIEGLRAVFDGDHENWAIMREFGPGFRRRAWNKALVALGVHDSGLAESLDLTFERERGETNPYCPGADEALAVLAERYRLGMVTNGIPDVQRKKIEETGLADRFDALVISGELGEGKPNRGIYEHTLKLMGSTADETIMVGDNYRRDVLGPQAMGIRGVWISMGREKPEGEEPWLTVESLAELPDLLANT